MLLTWESLLGILANNRDKQWDLYNGAIWDYKYVIVCITKITQDQRVWIPPLIGNIVGVWWWIWWGYKDIYKYPRGLGFSDGDRWGGVGWGGVGWDGDINVLTTTSLILRCQHICSLEDATCHYVDTSLGWGGVGWWYQRHSGYIPHTTHTHSQIYIYIYIHIHIYIYLFSSLHLQSQLSFYASEQMKSVTAIHVMLNGRKKLIRSRWWWIAETISWKTCKLPRRERNFHMLTMKDTWRHRRTLIKTQKIPDCQTSWFVRPCKFIANNSTKWTASKITVKTQHFWTLFHPEEMYQRWKFAILHQ